MLEKHLFEEVEGGQRRGFEGGFDIATDEAVPRNDVFELGILEGEMSLVEKVAFGVEVGDAVGEVSGGEG